MYISEIQSIGFGIFSAEEIEKLSVCKLDNSKKTGPGSVYDLRMGAVNNNDICETCNEGPNTCPGHFGHIKLEEEITNPSYTKHIAPLLKSYCSKCSRLLLTKEQIYLHGLNKYKGEARYNKVVELASKIDICCQPNPDGTICGNDQPDVKYNLADNTISMVLY